MYSKLAPIPQNCRTFAELCVVTKNAKSQKDKRWLMTTRRTVTGTSVVPAVISAQRQFGTNPPRRFPAPAKI